MRPVRLFIARLMLALGLVAIAPVSVGAQNLSDTDLGAMVNALAGAKFADTEKAIEALTATGEIAVVPIFEALAEGRLYARKSDGLIFVIEKDGKQFQLFEPLTGEAAGEAGKRELKKVRVNNRLRRSLREAIGALTLMSPDAQVRVAAANSIFLSQDPDSLAGLEAALSTETDPAVKRQLAQARAAVILNLTPEADEAVDAIAQVAGRGDRAAVSVLSALLARDPPPPAVREAVEAALGEIERELAVWEAAQNVWYGISLGSVLFLAAIGLAITFGVMGVINMAHGEMVMLGAYTTFVVQEIIRGFAPGLFDFSLLIALPAAFLIAGAVGIAIERSVIRWLYGRPLETLLATWGLSLLLQQAIRSIFGPTNREVGNPSWMSGAFELGNLSITYSRLWIVVFALLVFAVLMVVLRKSFFGLQMRAVTQNRAMASSMGIRTPWIDALTFGLGSGIAGVAGVALSQIDNVSPNLGQSYIIDSFMVVVFGGVGNLWGTLVGALTLGVINKFLEPYAGAVLGKIFVLVFIILFIQKRPRGLFALKGRAVDT